MPPRAVQAPLLRAELRLWLMEHRVGTDTEADEVLAAVTKVFMDAVGHPGQLRSIAVEIDASRTGGILDLTVHDYATGTVELQRFMTQASPRRSGLVAGSST